MNKPAKKFKKPTERDELEEEHWSVMADTVITLLAHRPLTLDNVIFAYEIICNLRLRMTTEGGGQSE